MATALDHLVIVAADLDQGARYCEDMLGVTPSGGGQHPRMGTHNRLLSLGPGLYLEVIAAVPGSSAATGARWFGMDDPAQRLRVAQAPELVTFAARTEDIEAVQAAVPGLGTAIDMQRDQLRWRITVRDDGALQEGGCLPTVLQWPPGVHPSSMLPDHGCRLLRLEAFHPEPERLRARWDAIGLLDDRMVIRPGPAGSAPGLVAYFDTPSGPRRIGSAVPA